MSWNARPAGMGSSPERASSSRPSPLVFAHCDSQPRSPTDDCTSCRCGGELGRGRDGLFPDRLQVEVSARGCKPKLIPCGGEAWRRRATRLAERCGTGGEGCFLLREGESRRRVGWRRSRVKRRLKREGTGDTPEAEAERPTPAATAAEYD